MEYPIGGFGCLGAANLAHGLVRVVCPCFLGFSWFPCPNCGRILFGFLPGMWALVSYGLYACWFAWSPRGLVLVIMFRADSPFPMF